MHSAMKINLAALETEQSNVHSRHLDQMETLDILKTINREDQTVAMVIETLLPTIQAAVDAAYERLKVGGRLIYIGAGTSGRLGVLDASECPPTYGVSKDLIQGLIAGGYPALLVAQEGAEDSEELAAQDLKNISLTAKDVVCGLAASGRTPYVIGGLRYAKTIGALTLSICCVSQGAISKFSEHPMEAVVGPEVISGSTRMKAGTAQKLILNMISTSLMVKMGKIYGNLMVDIQATNAKLVERAKKIIMQSTACSYEEAEIALLDSGYDVKTAIVMILANLSKEESIAYLRENDGNISRSIHAMERKKPIPE